MLDVIEKTIRGMDTHQLISRWRAGQFSDQARPIAADELAKRGINPDGPMPEAESGSAIPEQVSDFSLDDLPFLRRLFSFKGRASRLKFWLIVPLAWVAFVAIGVVFEVLFERVSYPVLLLSVFGPLIPIAWVHWATIVQRLHDRNKSGTRAWLLFIPIIGPIWALIELGCLPGTRTANRYGRPSP